MYQNHTKDTNNNCSKSLLCENKAKLVQSIKRIKHEVDECREAERDTYTDSVEVENRFDELEREVRAEFQNLHRFLEEEEHQDLERLRRERQKLLKQLKEREKKIDAQGRDLERAITVLNSKLAEEDSPKLFKEIQDLVKRSQVHFIRPAEVDTEVPAGWFVGPIQYRIWKHMKSCLYPNCKTNGCTDAELWICAASRVPLDLSLLVQPVGLDGRPGADITSVRFDPDTAHPNLCLSESCTSVWFDVEKDTSEVQANPRRFHYYYCLLGHRGFSTGRHYWEVEVGYKTAWRLGVAREDVPRGEMTATGTSIGLWTLAFKGGSLLACTDPKPTKITVSAQLVRIGVFLDCEGEEVTFYNAVTMAPIYTFSMGTVMVPLFPFFNPCDTDDGKNMAPITIFNPSL